jgi:hypothetical protein
MCAQFYSYSALASMQRGSFVGKGQMKRGVFESKWLTLWLAQSDFRAHSNVPATEAVPVCLN